MTQSNRHAQNSEPKGEEMSRLHPSQASLATHLFAGTLLTLALALPSLTLAQVQLLPAPREAHFSGETPLPAALQVSVPGHDAEDEFAARDLEDAVKALPA